MPPCTSESGATRSCGYVCSTHVGAALQRLARQWPNTTTGAVGTEEGMPGGVLGHGPCLNEAQTRAMLYLPQ